MNGGHLYLRERALLDSLEQSVFETDAEGHCLYVNPRWCEHAGLSADEALGDGWVQALHPEDRERVRRLRNDHLAAGLPWKHEYRFLTPEGRCTWLAGTTTPVRVASGAVVGYLGLNLDPFVEDLYSADGSPRREMA